MGVQLILKIAKNLFSYHNGYSSYSVQAQVVPCPPNACYTWQIVNNTDMELTLDTEYFGEPKCSSLNGEFISPVD